MTVDFQIVYTTNCMVPAYIYTMKKPPRQAITCPWQQPICLTVQFTITHIKCRTHDNATTSSCRRKQLTERCWLLDAGCWMLTEIAAIRSAETLWLLLRYHHIRSMLLLLHLSRMYPLTSPSASWHLIFWLNKIYEHAHRYTGMYVCM